MFHGTIRKATRQMSPKSLAMCMTATLQELLITVEVVKLEKLSFNDTQNPKTVC